MCSKPQIGAYFPQLSVDEGCEEQWTLGPHVTDAALSSLQMLVSALDVGSLPTTRRVSVSHPRPAHTPSHTPSPHPRPASTPRPRPAPVRTLSPHPPRNRRRPSHIREAPNLKACLRTNRRMPHRTTLRRAIQPAVDLRARVGLKVPVECPNTVSSLRHPKRATDFLSLSEQPFLLSSC